MIVIVLLILILLLLAATPWRRLPTAGQFWAVAALLNASVFFGVPTTPAPRLGGQLWHACWPQVQ